MPKRMYLVDLKRKKVLVEAASQEAAIKAATAPMVKSCTIPTPLETARLMNDGVEIISDTIQRPTPEPEQASSEGEGVGRLGIQDSPPPVSSEQEADAAAQTGA